MVARPAVVLPMCTILLFSVLKLIPSWSVDLRSMSKVSCSSSLLFYFLTSCIVCEYYDVDCANNTIIHIINEYCKKKWPKYYAPRHAKSDFFLRQLSSHSHPLYPWLQSVLSPLHELFTDPFHPSLQAFFYVELFRKLYWSLGTCRWNL